jgi:hypothetical protein
MYEPISAGAVPRGTPGPVGATWRLRRSRLARRALGWVAAMCLVALGFVALITLAFVSAFGHPVAWSLVGLGFAIPPLVTLVLVAGVGLRAAVAAGPRWLAVRFVGPWHVVRPPRVTVIRIPDEDAATPRLDQQP